VQNGPGFRPYCRRRVYHGGYVLLVPVTLWYAHGMSVRTHPHQPQIQHSVVPLRGVSGPKERDVSDQDGSVDTRSAQTDDSIAAAQLWQAVLAEIRQELNRNAYENFFRHTALQAVDDEQAIVSAPNAFTATTLQSRYSSPVERAIHNLTGQRLRVEFVVRPG